MSTIEILQVCSSQQLKHEKTFSKSQKWLCHRLFKQVLRVTLGPRYALDYTLQGTQVTMTVYCAIGQQGNDGRLYIRWDGGGAFLAYWCPYED